MLLAGASTRTLLLPHNEDNFEFTVNNQNQDILEVCKS